VNSIPSPQAHPVPKTAGLFRAFLRLGLTAFGGPATIAYIREMAVERKRWLDDASFRDGVALCQAIPGATAMQTAAYVGLRLHGLAGAAASFTGFGLPAFTMMMALSALYVRGHELPLAVSAFAGLGALVVAIVANATVSFGARTLQKRQGWLIALAAAGSFGLGTNPLAVILFAALLGLILFKAQRLPAGSAAAPRKLYSSRSFTGLLVLTGATLTLLFIADPRLFKLAALMAKIDVSAFGGGFASVPIMFHEIVDVRHWLDGPTLLNGIALGQVTPGPIVITATFIGYLLSGPLGGIVATMSVFLPSFLVVVGVAPYYDRLRLSGHFQRAIEGILCSFVGLLFSVTVRLAMNVSWDVIRMMLAVAAFVALRFKVNILWVVLIGTIISMLTF
jgi:chromate transporter